MAQIELRFFDEMVPQEDKLKICQSVSGLVFRVHYPHLVPSRRGLHGLRLQPGDITLAVPVLDTVLSSSDAQFEIEVSEGSSNWPRTPERVYLAANDAREALDERANLISIGLQREFVEMSHNIFEVTGLATGWAQYKPADKIK